MNSNNITALLDSIRPLLSRIVDVGHKLVVETLLNLVESLHSELLKESTEKQLYKDEVNRLKGEQGKPKIKSKKRSNQDISSEKERKRIEPKTARKARLKAKSKLKIHKAIKRKVDKSTLPSDAVFKGYKEVIIQDFELKVTNTKFIREVYYSPSRRQTYSAELPKGWHGDFSPSLKALILTLYHDSHMSEPVITSFLNTHGVLISETTVSKIVTKEFYDQLCQEKLEIVAAGLRSSSYQHIDDTKSRVNGINYHTIVLCNPFYTAYFTEEKKDRLTVIKVLGGGKLFYELNPTAYRIMKNLHVGEVWIKLIKNAQIAGEISEEELKTLLETIFPKENSYPVLQNKIRESCAIAGYRKNLTKDLPILVCDDAPQFKEITEEIALCWVHGGRHFKKLTPLYSYHKELLDSFLTDFWNYYRLLLDYKKSPSAIAKKSLEKLFDELFTRKTSYFDLDDRIRKTYANKESLLTVLTHPQVPLHNNPAELEVRHQKRREDVSFQTKTDIGTKAKDAAMTIVQTAKKLKVNSYRYFLDRVSQSFELPSLGELITENSS